MPPVLIKELGLEDRKPLGSSEQAEKFKAEFQAAIGPINECLRFTAAHADKSKHDSQAANRDKIYEAYQVTLNQIDPADPTVAQKSIDKVLASVKQLQSSLETGKSNLDESHKEWTARETSFEEHCDKIREMEEGKHEKAPALQKVSDAITGKANARAYGEAVTAFDQLSGKLGPIYEEFQKQKASPADGKTQPSSLAVGEGKTGGAKPKVDPQAEADFKRAIYAQKALHAKADATTHADDPALKELERVYKEAKKALGDLVTAGKYKEAQAKLPDVTKKAQTYVDKRKAYDDKLKAILASMKIETETVSTVPSNRTRKKIGVGEEVKLTLKPAGLSPIKWELKGNGKLSSTKGNSVTFTAHDAASKPTVTATYSGASVTVEFEVVAPSGITFAVDSSLNGNFPAGQAGTGMLCSLTFGPADVSFYRIEFLEVPGPATNVTGYFANPPWTPALRFHNPNTAWFGVNANNTLAGLDMASFGSPMPNGTGGWPAWSDGGFDWIIPNKYRVKGASATGGHEFQDTTQIFTIKANGDTTVSKQGSGPAATISRSP